MNIASTGRYYISSAFFDKIEVCVLPTCSVIETSPPYTFFLEIKTFSLFILFKTSFRYIFQEESVVSFLYMKVAV